MKNRLAAVLLVIAVGVFFLSGTGFAVVKDKAPGSREGMAQSGTGDKKGLQKPKYREGELLVKFKPGASVKSKDSLHQWHGSKKIKEFRSLRLHHIKLNKGMSVEEAIAQYKADPEVEYAEPNYIYQAQTMPNDPSFGILWGLDNTGQTGGTPDADINAPEAWSITTGSPDTVVAVIDSGVDYNHQDLAANIWVNPGEIPGNGIDDDGNGFVDDVHGINAIANSGDPMDDLGHGTHVSGTIAAKGNNGFGVVGVNWNAKIIACKFLDSSGYGSDSGALTCLDYLYQLKTRPINPVNIILSSNSWGGGGDSQALRDAIDLQRQAGMLFVAAAGNLSTDMDIYPAYPSGYYLPNIISVAATNPWDSLDYYSNYGRRTVHVAAPGVDILSTIPNNGYASHSGTSMATPHVSGLAALLKSQDPSRDWKTIKNLILAGGQDIPAANGTTITGKRIRAADANGAGSLTCANQIKSERLKPMTDALNTGAGQPVNLAVLNIDCGVPNGSVVVSVISGTAITLQDDGLGIDQEAGDGVYSGQWTPPGLGEYTLTFPGNDVVIIRVVLNYVPAEETAYSYRTIDGINLSLGDDQTAMIISPFLIPFGGFPGGFTDLFISSNGTVNFSFPDSWYYNYSLPIDMFEINMFQTLVAPFWDDLDPGIGGGVYWDVLGTAPNRELVVEWRNVPNHVYRSGSVTFQTVFFENSSDILFNYQDVILGDLSYDAGASATVGIQVAPNLAQQFSYNAASLRDSMSLIWRVEGFFAEAGPDQFVLPGASVTLDGSKSRNNFGSITGYQWTQTAGTPVTLTGADTAAPSFVAPGIYGNLTFQLTITNQDNETTSDSVAVIVNLPPVADAGPDQTVVSGSMVTLNGGSSYDPNGTIASFLWTQLSGPAVTLTGANTATPAFTAPAAGGTLTFRLTVTDDSGQSVSDTVSILVKVLPVAEAGVIQWALPGSSVTLNGGGSYDPDGTISGYSWTQTAGPAVVLSGAGTATPAFTSPNVNTMLSFDLTVTDNEGLTATDSVSVNINIPPVANAGPDQTVLANSPVTLDGTGSSDPDGTIQSYSWTQTAGTAVVLTGADTSSPVFTAPTARDTLTFRLIVSDNSDQPVQDDVNIIVLPLLSTTATSTNYIFGTWTSSLSVSVTLTADGPSDLASGYPRYCVDATDTCTPETIYNGSFNVTCAIGATCTQYVRYFSQDVLGTTEAVKSSLVYQTSLHGTISTIAGKGAYTYGGDGGAAALANLNSPRGVFVDISGNIFIADTSNHRIRKVNASDGKISTVAGNGTWGYEGDGGPATSASLSNPGDVFVDVSGNIFIADTYNQRIRKVNVSDGKISTVAGNGSATFSGDGDAATEASLNYPYAVFADISGNIFIGDTFSHRIRKVNASDGKISTVAGNGSATFSGDGGAAAEASLNYPYGVFGDVSGNIFIADYSNHRIRKVNALDGTISTVAGNGTGGYAGDGGAATAANLSSPQDIFADLSGDLIITEFGNRRIRKVDASDGTISTVAGNGLGGYAGDGGVATSAGIVPRTAVMDAAGNIFIADTAHSRIRKVIETTPPVTTASATGYTFGIWTSSNAISVTLSASDGSGIASGYPRYCTDTTDSCTPNSSYSSAINVTCAAGSTCTQHVRYQSMDNVGNMESVRSVTVNQDLQLPAAVISSPSSTVTINGPVNFTVTYSDANFESSALDAADVTLNTTGTATGTVSVTGSGSMRTVTIGNITGSGTMSISLAAGTAVDLAGNTASAVGPSETFSVTTPDTTPDPVVFATQTNMPVNTLATSNSITVTGINTLASITISGGQYEINNSGTWTSAGGTVANGNTVRVRLTTSAAYNTLTSATLTIGGVNAVFNVTTTVNGASNIMIPGTTPAYFSSLQAAFNAAANNDTIMSQATEFIEDLVLGRPVSIVLSGGYDSSFSSNSGSTAIKGSLTIGDGTITIGGAISIY